MSPIPSALGILGGRSPRDLAGRAVQVARAKLESVGVGDRGRASPESLLRAVRRAGVTGAEDLLGRFRTRVETTSLPAFRDPARTTSRLRARWPELGVRLLGRARAIEAGRFELLGHAALEFGDPIDWWLDPLDGRRAPDVHWSRVPYLDSTVVGDHKVVWELNRQHYLACLGQTAWLEDDDGWADVCFAHLDAWMTANPPKRGINWVSSLELAFRSIAWLWALHFFARSPRLDPDRFARIVAVLRAHGRHVEHYISTSFSPNTHLTGEALGLYYLGTMLPELPESERWRRRGKAWLMDALEFQIRPDGGYFEASIHYHRYTVDFYNHLLLLTRLFEGGAPEGLEVRLESIAEHLVAVTRLDGTTPLVGDDD
ncbi:MAG: hypothetical protein MJB57_13125, partial [Gemmatimonadetes bacterium]|nr:hypothetical protein [Gemmatimonadota bacterium]